MSNVYWVCERCGKTDVCEFSVCRHCKSEIISREVENGPDGREHESIAENDVNDCLDLMEKHRVGVRFATIN
jgi:hypothetical protein